MIKQIQQSIEIDVSAEQAWAEIIDLDITAFRHSVILQLLGVPKPLFAELQNPGPNGQRVAHFANGKTFTQQITRWDAQANFEFTFVAEPGFRVGYLLDLQKGAFQMKSGAYRIEKISDGVRLYLSSKYQLTGLIGAILALPVRIVLYMFQRYL